MLDFISSKFLFHQGIPGRDLGPTSFGPWTPASQIVELNSNNLLSKMKKEDEADPEKQNKDDD